MIICDLLLRPSRAPFLRATQRRRSLFIHFEKKTISNIESTNTFPFALCSENFLQKELVLCQNSFFRVSQNGKQTSQKLEDEDEDEEEVNELRH